MTWHKVIDIGKKHKVTVEKGSNGEIDSFTTNRCMHSSLFRQYKVKDNEVWVWVESTTFSNLIRGYSVGEKPKRPLSDI